MIRALILCLLLLQLTACIQESPEHHRLMLKCANATRYTVHNRTGNESSLQCDDPNEMLISMNNESYTCMLNPCTWRPTQ